MRTEEGINGQRPRIFQYLQNTKESLLMSAAKTTIVSFVHCKPVEWRFSFTNNFQWIIAIFIIIMINIGDFKLHTFCSFIIMIKLIVTPLLQKSSILVPHTLPLLYQVGHDLLEILLLIQIFCCCMFLDIQYDACKVAHCECVRTNQTSQGEGCQQDSCQEEHNWNHLHIQW